MVMRVGDICQCPLEEMSLKEKKTETIRSIFFWETNSMKVTRFKKLMVALSATCVLATVNGASVSAQTTTTASPTANQEVAVTSDSSTWIQVLQANGIDIPAGADGVVISNGAGGVITCLLYTSPSPRDKRQSRMPSSA